MVGAGLVGLSCAWHLQELGFEVAVVDREGVASGASWGNAGWLTPSLSAPLPEPAVLRYGIKAITNRSSPLVVPLRPSGSLSAFLAEFALNCRAKTWSTSMASMRQLNQPSLSAYDQMIDGDVQAETVSAPVVCGFIHEDDAHPLIEELRLMVGSGQEVHADFLTSSELSAAEPLLAQGLRFGVRIHGQRYVDPARFTHALAEAVVRRGGTLTQDWPVTAVARRGDRIVIKGKAGELESDAVVIATGAWLPQLVRPHGVKVRVQAGRGYSLTIAVPSPPQGPLYFPKARLACTPVADGRMRVAGMMEFGSPDAPGTTRRWDLLLSTLAPYFDSIDADSAEDLWRGPRPVSADGLPIIGGTSTPGVFVAGGHGMWGVTLGPITGRVLAEHVAGRTSGAELRAFSPLR